MIGFLEIRLGYLVTPTRLTITRYTPSRKTHHQSTFPRFGTDRQCVGLETFVEKFNAERIDRIGVLPKMGRCVMGVVEERWSQFGTSR